jgi:hypothetical protein
MPYYPSNRIQLNLYTDGTEYALRVNGLPYAGFYYKLYNGLNYTGKTPNDSNSQQLIPLSEILSIPTPEEVNKYVTIDYFGSTENLDYNNLLSETPPNKLIPLPSYPTPTKDDYKIGEFQRYFVKQINALIYIEVSQNTYDNIFTRNSSWSYEPYLTISIPWQLVGTKNEVEEINKKIVLLAEVDNKVFGFGEYIIITGGFSKFYI